MGVVVAADVVVVAVVVAAAIVVVAPFFIIWRLKVGASDIFISQKQVFFHFHGRLGFQSPAVRPPSSGSGSLLFISHAQ